MELRSTAARPVTSFSSHPGSGSGRRRRWPRLGGHGHSAAVAGAACVAVAVTVGAAAFCIAWVAPSAGSWLQASKPHAGVLSSGQRPSENRHRFRRKQEEGKTRRRAAEEDEDWRAFRARLVEQEGGAKEDGGDVEADTKEEGWSYETPLIEQGSVLLAAPGDHFAINQQYFHKSVILITEHSKEFTKGIILNRPTAFSSSDLDDVFGKDVPDEDWNVWFGGDCQGINSRSDARVPCEHTCLHTLEKLADESREVIKGVFQVGFAKAQELIRDGIATKDDFLVLVGYCGWAPQQLQGELDRGQSWTMVAADQRKLLGRLQDAQTALTARLRTAAQAKSSMAAADVGDGLEDWTRLYRGLGKAFVEKLDGAFDDMHTDDMLRRWIDRQLIPAQFSDIVAEADVLEAVARRQAQTEATVSAADGQIKSGTLIRGSASAWLLGRPDDRPLFQRMELPGQYLHKAVLLALNDANEESPCVLLLLNGPLTGTMRDGKGGIFFGGPNHLPMREDGIIEVAGEDGPCRFRGVILFMPGVVQELLRSGALEMVDAKDADVKRVLAAPAHERWQLAGGTINGIRDAAEASLGDRQKRKWYKRFLDLSLDDDGM
eukprot:TRINITY_DN21966_c0_g2_i1.p1 TRINITY_DN21966_c0_g2~~TRINITY_DN21966_c0_g2_i1.p1  ORF type:complete len:604 (-),score=151.20 TRINITY_DN21966_c0_g2_i1:203-2014(-)